MWPVIAQRIVRGVGVRQGELILVRDDTGRFDILQELLLAIEKSGATPLVHLTPINYMERLWRTASARYLASWDQHRQEWVQKADRIIVLSGPRPDLNSVPAASFQTWHEAEHRLTMIEEERQLPYLMVGIPTERQARQLGMSLADLEKIVVPALQAPIDKLQDRISRILGAARNGTEMVIHSGANCELHLKLGDRPWLSDDGYIDEEDRAKGAIVSNLPAGSIYTTVLEDQTEGTLWLPQAAGAQDVVLTFVNGRVSQITASAGAEQLAAMFDQHEGEPRRIGHIGIGLNPELSRPIGWTVIDEHVLGYLFISFGENRYMGGQNESTLNVDFALPNATLLVNERPLVKDGQLPFQFY
ncbi:MAG: aminopeptidase [Anaerolineales bacterium]|nr:aminopeptidase [Anaerolineales bacterium]